VRGEGLRQCRVGGALSIRALAREHDDGVFGAVDVVEAVALQERAVLGEAHRQRVVEQLLGIGDLDLVGEDVVAQEGSSAGSGPHPAGCRR